MQSCKLRINAMPTKSRTGRGRPKDRLCRAGCNWPETLDHVLQKCHRTHGLRTKRHDAITSYIAQGLSRHGCTVDVEPKFQTANDLRKPDIVAVKQQQVLVIDAQIVNDQIDLDEAHRKKSGKYRDLEEMLKEKYSVPSIKYTFVTLSWRGIWSAASANELLDLRVIKKKSLKVISSRVIVEGIAAFNQFGRTTSVKVRKGV